MNYLMFNSTTTGTPEQNNKDIGYRVDDAFPNPAGSFSVINYSISSPSHVEIKLFDILGREVGKVFSREENPGEHSVVENMSDFPSGVYFCLVLVNGQARVKKIFLIK